MAEQKSEQDIKDEISKLSEDGKKLFICMLHPSELVGATKPAILAGSNFDEILFDKTIGELRQHNLVEVGKLEGGLGEEKHFVEGEDDRFRLNAQVKQEGFKFFKITPPPSLFKK